jgi:hypothetical protein
MITDYCSLTTKKRAKETTTEQDTPQARQRMNKDYTNNTRNPRQRAASADHDKP